MNAGAASFLTENAGPLTGALVKIGGAIGTGIASRKAARRARRRTERELANQEARLTREYNELYNANPWETAANQRGLTLMQDYLRERRKQAAGAEAVTGATTELIAAQKAADNAAVSNTFSNMAANADLQKQRLREQYNSDLTGLSNQRIGNIQQYNTDRQQQIAIAGQNINSAGDSLSKIGQKNG